MTLLPSLSPGPFPILLSWKEQDEWSVEEHGRSVELRAQEECSVGEYRRSEALESTEGVEC